MGLPGLGLGKIGRFPLCLLVTQLPCKEARAELLNKRERAPWSVWLRWLGISPQSKRLTVRFLVRVHTWILGLVPVQGINKRQLIDVSLSHPCFSPSLSPLPLSKNKFKKDRERASGPQLQALQLSDHTCEHSCLAHSSPR